MKDPKSNNVIPLSTSGSAATPISSGNIPGLVVHGAYRPMDAYGRQQIENLILPVKGLYIRQFLQDVLAIHDLRHVLITPIRATDKEVLLLVDAIKPIADEAQEDGTEYTDKIDALYVATILKGIDYCMLPALCGKYGTPHALYQMVRPYLERLRQKDKCNAEALQLCMRWDQFDVTKDFNEWLNTQVDQALRLLELADF